MGFGRAFAATLLTAAAAAAPADAATFTVTRFNDPAPGACLTSSCSLREAIRAANATAGADDIVVPAGIYTLALAGTAEDAAVSGDLDITDSVTIAGAGAGITIIDGGAAAVGERVFDILPNLVGGKAVTITGLTIRNGASDRGAGIRISGSNNSITFENVVVSGNAATVSGGGISYSGGSPTGTMTVLDSAITGNTAPDAAGIDVAGRAVLTGVTVSGNKATGDGGGVRLDASGLQEGLTLTASTLSANEAEEGGGLWVSGFAQVINSTISGNLAVEGAGIYAGFSSGVNLSNATVAENVSSDAMNAGGIFTDASAITMANSIVAGNKPVNCLGQSAALIASLGHNLSDDASCNLTKTGDHASTVAGLGPLASHGGPTATHALLPGSPAIDGGDPTGCRVSTTPLFSTSLLLTTDQRGRNRPFGAACDIGAFEVSSPILTLSSSANPVSSCGTLTLTATVVSPTGLIPTGTVVFWDDINPLAVQVLRFGVARLTTVLSAGSHNLVATYSGDAVFDPATATLQQFVTPFTVSITGAPTAAIARGSSITLTGIVTSGGTAPFTFKWTRDGAPLANGATLVDRPPQGTHTYSLTGVDATACVSPPAQVTVVVLQPPPLKPFDLVVADRGLASGAGSVIVVRRPQGKQWVSSTGGQLIDPVGVVVDNAHRIFVVDFAAAAVIRIDHETGDQTLVSSGGLLVNPTAIALDGAGRLIVTAFTATISPLIATNGLNSGPGTGGTISSVGRVVRVDPATGAQTLVSSGGSLVMPAGVAVDAGGKLIVTDQGLFAAPKLLQVDPVKGSQTTLVAGGKFIAPVGVAIDPCTGLILVADSGGFGGAGAAVIATDPVTHVQATVSSGGSFVGPAGAAILLPRTCGGGGGLSTNHLSSSPLLVVADPNAFGNSFDGPGGLIGVAATGAQAVISSAGLFADPFGVAVVPPGPQKPHPSP